MKMRQKLKPHDNIQTGQGQHHQQAMIFQTPQMEAILKLKQKYERNVEQTIHLIEDLNHNKMPQKCIQHNNNFTLYCQNDQKPLCASCMYQNQVHKIHKVLPLSACGEFLKRDCQKLEKELGFIVDNMNGLVKHVNDGISRMDKDFPHLVWRIEDCYKKLHNFLLDREKEHVNQLRYYKQRMKYQHGALSTELSKISLYIQQKIEQYSRKSQNEHLLTKRNIFDSLKTSAKIVADQLNIKEEQGGPKLNFQIFNQVQQFIYAKLPRLFMKDSDKRQQKNIYRNPSLKRINSKSKQKISFSPVSIQQKQKRKDQTAGKNQKEKKESNSKSKQKIDKSIKKTPTKSVKGARPTSKTPPKTPPKQRSKSNIKSNIKKSPTRNQKSSKKNSANKSRNSSPARK